MMYYIKPEHLNLIRNQTFQFNSHQFGPPELKYNTPKYYIFTCKNCGCIIQAFIYETGFDIKQIVHGRTIKICISRNHQSTYKRNTHNELYRTKTCEEIKTEGIIRDILQ